MRGQAGRTAGGRGRLNDVRIADFDFDLPERLIAQHPPAARGDSRLLVLDRQSGMVDHAAFRDLPRYLRAGDLLVVNDTRVFPARLLGRRVPSGGAVECLLVRPVEVADEREAVWEALMHPGQKLKPGARVRFDGQGDGIDGEVLARLFFGRRTIRLRADGSSLTSAIERIGHIPLPPYIKRGDTVEDRERYQTIFARDRGSIAAPTAGLHFTPGLLETLAAHGVQRAAVTLHVGYGTFKPVRAEEIDGHRVDAETFSVAPAAAAALTAALREGRRIIAVGTTTARALESLPIEGGTVHAHSGATELFIRPGHDFRLVSGLVTNFHLPRSSLLLLVAALAGREPVLAAYREAIAREYRFYSYGDAMVIL